MKNYEVTYSQGHLVDTKTGKRIFLKRGGKFNILGDDDQFEEHDQLLLDKEVLGKEAKLAQLQTKYGRGQCLVKILDAGEDLRYRIGLSKGHPEDKASEFLFNAVLLEDLYMYSLKEGKKWQLCDCICETRKCLEGELQMIEPIQGKSLNSLFSNMVAFYFPLQRSGACNAFTTFHAGPSINSLAELKYYSKEKQLAQIRDDVKNKFL